MPMYGYSLESMVPNGIACAFRGSARPRTSERVSVAIPFFIMRSLQKTTHSRGWRAQVTQVSHKPGHALVARQAAAPLSLQRGTWTTALAGNENRRLAKENHAGARTVERQRQLRDSSVIIRRRTFPVGLQPPPAWDSEVVGNRPHELGSLEPSNAPASRKFTGVAYTVLRKRTSLPRRRRA